jgi:hypothetical protein
MNSKLYQVRKIKISTKTSHQLLHTSENSIENLLLFKEQSGLIYLHQIPDENKDFELFLSKNAFKFIF